MTPRLRPVLAIASRDLRSELRGRQGLGLPVMAAALLLLVALVGAPAQTEGDAPIEVQGQLPIHVREHPAVRAGGGTGMLSDEGVTRVYAYRIEPRLREILDQGQPSVRVHEVGAPLRVPGRSLLFALVSASTLTGAVAGSIGGERARHTLQALLSAAVTRLEIVAGKWLAWTAFGTVGALFASAVAIASGRSEPGLWLAAMPVVPGLTVAIGLWLVRRSGDLIAGTTVSLRVMPAVIVATGLASWGLAGLSDPLGALVPLGGALMVAGGLWAGSWGLDLLALSSSVAATAALLVWTARDLDQTPARVDDHRVRPALAIPDGLLATASWWSLLAIPAMWGWAGNPAITALLAPWRGLLAGAALLAMLSTVRWASATRADDAPKLGRPSWTALPAAALVAAATALPALPLPTNPWASIVAERFDLGLHPAGLVALPLLLAQETWFRGWIQRRAGLLPQALVWTVAIAPHHPLSGLISGLALGWAAQAGLLNAVFARALALAAVLAFASA